MKFRWRFWVGVAVLSVLVGSEIGLRLLYGLGHPALLQADPKIGYLFQPNQNLVRFGKRIIYNQYSQRSEPTTREKPPGILRILMVGDSLLNGGNPTDQSQTISELFEDSLKAAGFKAEVLNASAGSWGMENRLAYLQKFGLFQSDAVILQVGSNDLPQPTSTSERVDHDPNYPSHPFLLAWQELFVRYLWPIIASRLNLNSITNEIPVAINSEREFQHNQQILKTTISYVREQKIPVYVLFIPESRDMIAGSDAEGYRKFKAETMRQKGEFLQLLQALQVPIIDLYPVWVQLPSSQILQYYRDYVHVNEIGNAVIAKRLFEQLCLHKQLAACAR